jgi:hypothetical protein
MTGPHESLPAAVPRRWQRSLRASGWLVATTAAWSLLAATSGLCAEPSGSPVPVRVELTDADDAAGSLVAIDETGLRLRDAAEERTFALERVRRVIHETDRAADRRSVLVVTGDGGRLTGDDFLVDGDRAIVPVDGDRIELPLERVGTVAWSEPGRQPPDWLKKIPEDPLADLVVVRRDDGQAFVECAVVGVSAENVTVVLDGETIPVRREKVLGVVWLRENREPPGGTLVTLDDGRLAAGRLVWSPAGLLLDDNVRLPAAVFRSLNFAAGRRVALADLSPEQSRVEPFFGSLAKHDGLAAFFAVRSLTDPTGKAAGSVVMRPRTEATWRIPADSRRFRVTLERDAAGAAGTVEVCIKLDDREVHRGRLGATAGDQAAAGWGELIEFDVSGGRRLTLLVDFVPGDIGCGVRLSDGVFEK